MFFHALPPENLTPTCPVLFGSVMHTVLVFSRTARVRKFPPSVFTFSFCFPPSLPVFPGVLYQLTLPAGDDALPGEGGEFTAKQRWFDFSNVTLPWPDFQGIGDDPQICRPKTRDGGNSAFGYEGERSLQSSSFCLVFVWGVFFVVLKGIDLLSRP